jgi:hypothetical protein
MNLYRAIGDRVGTLEARDLAEQLVAWHDAMVKHLRVSARGGPCEEGCAHDEARLLWSSALETFGEDAVGLSFLRTHGGIPPAVGDAAAAPAYK